MPNLDNNFLIFLVSSIQEIRFYMIIFSYL